MPGSARALVQKIQEAAGDLGDARAIEVAGALQAYVATSRLQILVTGTTGSGRSSLVNAILGRSLLPQSPLPKAPVSLVVRHGAVETVDTVTADGDRAALPPARLRSFLTDPATSSGRYAGVEVQAPCELLRSCELRVEPLDAGLSPERWRDLLAAADFTLLVLNATALLSHLEREFIRQHLAAGYGLQRVAIVVNRMDQVPEDERASILELVRTFLGPFESQPAILDLSATEALQGRGASGEGGGPGLRTLMDDLVERHAPLRQEGLRGALQAALAELEAGAARQQALLSLDGTEVGRLRSEIDAHRGWLRQRVERAQLKVDTFVGTLIKDELLRAIEGFGQLFRRRLPDEIMAVEDLTTIRRYLPGYIETAWSEFMNRQMIVVRSRLIEEMGAIGRLAESDLRDLLGERAAGLAGAAGDFGLASEGLRTLIMPRRGKHHASGIIKGLSLHGYVMLFFNPPLGVASLLAGHVIRRRYQAGMDAADVRAVAGAAAAAALDLERALVKRVEEQFAALADGLKAEVASLYAEGISRIEESLAEAADRAQDVEGRRERLQVLRQEAIPALRRLLEDRHPEGHPEGTRA